MIGENWSKDLKFFGVMVTCNRPSSAMETLSLVFEQSLPPDEVIVVDNSGPKFACELGEKISELYGPDRSVLFRPQSKNLGPAGGIRVGVEELFRQHPMEDFMVVLIDDDDPPVLWDAFERLRDLYNFVSLKDESVVGVGLIGGILSKGLLPKPVNLAKQSGGEDVLTVHWINGGYLPIYERRAFEMAGGFEEKLFFGFEEMEFGLRLRRFGLSLVVDRSLWACVEHCYGKPRVRSGQRNRQSRLKDDWKLFWTTRNLHWILSSYGARRSAWYFTARRILGRLSVRHPVRSISCLMTIFSAISSGSAITLSVPPESRKPYVPEAESGCTDTAGSVRKLV